MVNSDCIVVMYHYVRDTKNTPYPEIKALSVTDFEAQLDWLENHFEIVNYDQFVCNLRDGNNNSQPCALLTFDDGFIDHYQTVYPLLKRVGKSGVFFISKSTMDLEPQLLNVHKVHFLVAKLGANAFSNEVQVKLVSYVTGMELNIQGRPGIYRYDNRDHFDIKRLLNYELPFSIADQILDEIFRENIGNPVDFARQLYMAPEMINEMADAGMTFGSHTRDHRVLSRMDFQDQLEQLKDGLPLVQNLTDQSSVPFCYPYGHTHTYDQNTVTILRNIGYSMAFNTVRSPVFFQTFNPYELPRFDTKDLPPFTDGIR